MRSKKKTTRTVKKIAAPRAAVVPAFKARIKEVLFSTFEHPYVVIDAAHQLLEWNGDLGLFLATPAPGAREDFFRVLHRELIPALRAIFKKALANGVPAKTKILRVEQLGATYYVRCLIKPLPQRTANEKYFLVIFENVDLGDLISGELDTVRNDMANIRAMLDNDLQAFLLLDPAGKIIGFNVKASDLIQVISGKPLRQGKSIFEFLPQKKNAGLEAALGKAVTGKAQLLEKQWKTQTGEQRWYTISLASVSAANGKLYGISMGMLDITDLKHALSDLNASERLIASVFNVVSTGICITDARGNFHDVNEEFCRIHGYRKEELIGRSFTMMVEPKFREQMQRLHDEFIRQGQEPPQEIEVLTKSGQPALIQVFADLLIKPDGSRYKVTSVKEVSELKQAESYLASVTNNLPGAVFRYRLNPDGSDKLMYLSKGAKLLWGMDAEECMEHNEKVWAMYHPDDLPIVLTTIRESASTLGKWQAEWRMVWPDGRITWQKGTGNPTRLPDGSVIWDSFIMDVTDRITAQLELNRIRQNQEALINGTNDYVWSIDPQYNLITANRSFVNLVQQLTGKPAKEGDAVLLDQMGAPQKKRWRNLYRRALDGEAFSEQEEYLHPATQTKRHAIVAFNPILDDQGKVTAVACYSKDITALKENEIALSKAKEELAKIMDSSLDIICSMDQDCRFLTVSKAAQQILGYAPAELVGKSCLDMIVEEDRPGSKKTIQSLMKGHQVTHFENRFRHKTGPVVPIIWSFNWDPQDKILFGVARDATEQKKHEAAILQSEEKYRLLFNASPLPKWIYRLSDYRILDVNQTAINVYGYTREEFLRLTLKDLRPKSEIPKLITAHDSIKQGQANISFGVFTHQTKSGALLRMEVYGNQIEYNGEACIVIACNDVTSKDNYLRQLEASERKLRQAGTIARLGYWTLDIDGKSLTWSDEVYRIWGRNREEFALTFQSFFETIHPNDREAFIREQEESFAGNKEHDFVHRILLPDGSVKWVHEIGLLHRHPDGSPMVFEGTVQDITEQKKEEQMLRLMQNVVVNASDAVVITEAEPVTGEGPKIIYTNSAFTTVTGYTAEEVLGKTPVILQGPKTERAELDKIKQALHRLESVEVTLINYRKNGEAFWNNISISPVADETGWFTHWIAIERDVTVQKNKELQKNLLTDISRIFAVEASVIMAVEDALQHLVAFGGFVLGEVWLVNTDQTALHHFAHFPDTERTRPVYESSGATLSFVKGEGFPGTVWEKREWVIWDDLKIRKEFIRKELVENAAIQSILGLPIWDNERIIGVLVLGTDEVQILPQQYENLFDELQNFLGAEIKRKLTEEQLNQFFNFSPELLCIVSKDGYFKKVNPTFTKILGFSEAEMLAVPFAEYLHPDDRVPTAIQLKDSTEGKIAQHFENRYRTKAGDYRWISWGSSELLSKEGLIFAYGMDITETKKLKDLLDEANKLARIGSWEIDLSNNKVFWSEITREIHEVAPDFVPMIDTAIQFYKEGESRDAIKKAVQEGMTGFKSWDLELMIVTAKAQQRWIRVIGQPEFKDGKCIRVYGSIQDIHQRKEVEVRLQKVTNNAPGVLFQYYLKPDGSEKLLYVTKGSESIWMLTPEQCLEDIRLVWKQIIAGGDIETVKETIQTSATKLTPWYCQWRNILPDGRIRWHEGRGLPERLADGTIVWDSQVTDITENKELEQLLDRATNMARIGSWEYNLTDHKSGAMYWSPMTRSILGVDDQYNPTLTGGYEFYTEASKKRIEKAVNLLIDEGIEFDEELLLTTAKGQPQWVRAIGQSERVDGRCTKIFGSFQDIHANKMLELQILQILDSISDAFFAVDSNWCFTYFNKEAENLLKREEQNILGKNIWDEFPEAVNTPIKTNFEAVAQSGRPFNFEFYYQPYDSWFEINAYPSNGGLSVFFRNIDERRKAAEALQKAYEERNSILESIGDAFIALDKDWTVTYWNKMAEQLLGKNRYDVVGKNVWEVYADARELVFYDKYKEAMDTGKNLVFEAHYPKPDMWVEVSVYPSGNGLSLYIKDVSIRKRAEEQVRQTNERFEKVTQATNDAIWDWDLHTDMVFWGGGYQTLFGYDVEEANRTLGSWSQHVHPDDLQRVNQTIEEVIQDATAYNWMAEYRFKKSNGRYAYVIDRGMIIRDSSGMAVRMVGAMTDITYRKEFEDSLRKLNETLDIRAQELARSNAELEQFAYIASHDLQEPLRMVSSFLTQLEKKYQDQLDEKARQYIHYAVDGAKRMRQIILDLLQFSRVGKQGNQTEKINTNELMETVCLLQQKMIEENNASVSWKNLPVVASFKAPLLQVFNNLINNAIKYRKTNVDPLITVSAKEFSDHWEFEVADNGIGIDSEFYEKIFVIFQRLHVKELYGGTGIGLAIVKKTVEHLGGRIWVNAIPDVGSSFFFTLPKHPE